ncbi:cytochrome c [Alkalihalobacillus sp. BA299]|uniref:c-type cytochrome n=1 Tax=Alkalihalobacillus sp. BA299 TaxID=2815938 RepID=UPI001ADB1F0C|nr:cytochrome c [Alkalihalobacillus sp. BA299]
MKYKKVLITLSAIVLFGIILFIGNNFFTDPFVESSIERGEEIYNHSCIQCHGNNGEARKISSATTLNNQEFLSLVSDEFLFKTIAEGRDNTKMPAFGLDNGGKLDQKEIKDIIAFIRAWQNKSIKMDTPEVIAGDTNIGQKLYKKNCLSCHANGIGPNVINPDFLKQASNEFLWATIAYGRSNTAMGPSLKGLNGVRQLTGEEINSLVVFLRSQGEVKEENENTE